MRESLEIGLGALVLVASCILGTAGGEFQVMGCTYAYLKLRCPNGDDIDVNDVYIRSGEEYSYCAEPMDPMELQSQDSLAQQCAEADCSYRDGLCDGSSSCVFYINPTELYDNQKIPIDSQVIVKYQCVQGDSWEAWSIVVAIVAAVLILILVIVGCVFIYKMWTSEEEYDTFSNPSISRSSSVSSVQRTKSGPPGESGAAQAGGSGDPNQNVDKGEAQGSVAESDQPQGAVEKMETGRYKKSDPEHVEVSLHAVPLEEGSRA